MKKIISYLVFLIGVVVCVSMRCNDLLNKIDPTTGFYHTQYEGDQYLCAAMAVVAILLAIIIGHQKLDGIQRLKSSPVLGVTAIAYGVVMLVYIFTEAAIRSINLFFLIYISLSFICSIFFILYGVMCVKGVELPSAIYIIPVAYACIRLIYVFFNYFGLLRTSDVVLEILMLTSNLIFWHFFGKYSAGIKTDLSREMLLKFGFVHAMSCFIYATPKYIIEFIKPQAEYRSINEHLFFDAATGIFVIIFMICITSKKLIKKQDIKTEDFIGETADELV